VNATNLIEKGFTGVMSCVRNLAEHPSKWIPSAIPLVTMMHCEERHGALKPVIEKALTDLKGPLFKTYVEERKKWALGDYYRSLGPLQYELDCLPPFLVKAPTVESMYNANL
jgi:pyrophosphate--fructose-6-phosphate 1-phosphotransferase